MQKLVEVTQSSLLEALTVPEDDADKKARRRVTAFSAVFLDTDVLRSAEMARNYCSTHKKDG